MRRGYRSYQILGLSILLFSLILVGLPALLARGCNGDGAPQIGPQGPEVSLQLQTGEVLTLPLEQYLIGVVAAEMPAEFSAEALKAQAVAARTYALRRLPTDGEKDEHADAELSADPDNCQAWIPVSEMRRRWGVLNFYRYYGKVATAVRDTAGEVVVYHGQLIEPVYCASCGGLGTEDAADVWGSAVPYLKSVPCPWEPLAEQKPVAQAFAYSTFCQLLGISEETVPTRFGLGRLIRILDRTPRGRVENLKVGKRIFKATDFRRALNLRSTAFTVKAMGNELVFECQGDGHAVGMCQWGAQGMALHDKEYEEILSYFYQGAQVTQWPSEFEQ